MKDIKTWAMLAALPVMASCVKDDPTTPTSTNNEFSNGVFITNEGPYQGGNGTLSFYNSTDGSLENDVFAGVNLRPLGNVVHSVSVYGDQAYIVVNNGGVVEVVDADNLNSMGTISGLQLPRYATGISATEIAISAWGTNTVEFYNPSTQSLIASVSTGAGPERMLVHNGLLYVANCGGFGLDSTVSVIDLATHTVVDTLWTGYNPNGFVVDANDDLWVLCGGYTDWGNMANNEEGSLYRFSTASRSALANFAFNSTDRPTGLCTDAAGETLYYLNDGYGGSPYAMDITASSTPSTPIVSGAALYSLGSDVINNQLYFADAVDYASAGKVYVYNLTSASVTDTLTVGIIPGNFAFNN